MTVLEDRLREALTSITKNETLLDILVLGAHVGHDLGHDAGAEEIRAASAEGYRVGMSVALGRVEGCRMDGASPVGPQHGAGWNDAIKHVTVALRDLIPPSKKDEG